MQIELDLARAAGLRVLAQVGLRRLHVLAVVGAGDADDDAAEEVLGSVDRVEGAHEARPPAVHEHDEDRLQWDLRGRHLAHLVVQRDVAADHDLGRPRAQCAVARGLRPPALVRRVVDRLDEARREIVGVERLGQVAGGVVLDDVGQPPDVEGDDGAPARLGLHRRQRHVVLSTGHRDDVDRAVQAGEGRVAVHLAEPDGRDGRGRLVGRPPPPGRPRRP